MTKRQTIGVVGYGYVGEAVAKGLAPVADVIVYDKAKGGMEIWDGKEGEWDEEWVENDPKLAWPPMVDMCSIIFVCVPSPMRQDGSCSTKIVEEVVRGLNDAQVETLNRLKYKGFVDTPGGTIAVQIREDWSSEKEYKITVVIKSTVPPGTTARLQKECGWLNLVFNPEFLTEANCLRDFAEMDRVILGGDTGPMIEVEFLYKAFYEDRGRETGIPSAEEEDWPLLSIYTCSSTEAEMVKYLSNCFLATKVSLANEFSQVCEKVGADWDTVWEIASTDERLGTSHWRVPGPDGKRGFGGSCFPKDLNAMIQFALDKGLYMSTLVAAESTNLKVRPERDWEQLKGRAVE